MDKNRIVTALLRVVTWPLRGLDALLIRTVVPVSIWFTQRGLPKSRQHYVTCVGAFSLLEAGFVVVLMSKPSFWAVLMAVLFGAGLVYNWMIARSNRTVDEVAESRGALTPRDVPFAIGRATGVYIVVMSGLYFDGTLAAALRVVFAVTFTAHYYLHFAPRFPPPREVRQATPARFATDAA